MKRDRVKFYMEDQNNVLAFFPEIEWSRGTTMCYSHIGQHSACSPDYVYGLPFATQEQYMPLLQELTSLGYDLTVIQ